MGNQNQVNINVEKDFWLKLTQHAVLVGGDKTLIVAPLNVIEEFGLRTKEAAKIMEKMQKAMKEAGVAWETIL